MNSTNERIGYDSLLAARVKQLKEIEDAVTLIVRDLFVGEPKKARAKAEQLRNDIADMIRVAEEEHKAF